MGDIGTAGEIISESVDGIIPERRAASPGIGMHVGALLAKFFFDTPA